MRRSPWIPLLTAAAVLAACGGSGGAAERDGDDVFGHRYGGLAPDGRETILIQPRDSARAVFVYPAVLDSVAVRPAAPRVAAGDSTRVEVLLKGALPDACSTLDAVRQQRTGHLISVALDMRQPRGRTCAQVPRPFRFYLALDDLYASGSYTLTANGVVRSFRILDVEPEGE